MERIVCITGADRGLGLALAGTALDHGMIVYAGRYMPELENLDELKRSHSESLHLIDLDITDDESVAAACGIISKEAGRLDILVNNAGILGDLDATIADTIDLNDMIEVFETNTLGPLRVTNALFPLIVKSYSRMVVNISSEAGSIADCGRKSGFGYCMSKTALNMQSVMIHNRLLESGGRVLVLHPGWMKTYMRGYKDEAADFTPGESAGKLIKIIIDYENYTGAKPAFLDLHGKSMNW